MKTYIINLRKDKKRKYHIAKECKKRKIKPIFIVGVNGSRSLEAKKIYEKNIQSSTKEMSLGEIGCFLSHQKLLKKIFLARKIYKVLILEDDIELDYQFPIFMKTIIHKTNFDIFFAGYHDIYARDSYNVGFRILKTTSCRTIGRLHKNTHGAYGYIISSQGVKKILQMIKYEIKPIDHFTGEVKKLKTLAIYPPLVTINDVHSNTSNLDFERSLHVIKRDENKYMFAQKIMEKIKIIPVQKQNVLYGFNDISRYVLFALRDRNITIVDSHKILQFRWIKIQDIGNAVIDKNNVHFFITALNEKFVQEIQEIICQSYKNAPIDSVQTLR